MMHLLALTLLLGVTHSFLVPDPPGPYSVAVKNLELVDHHRIDPFAPKANVTRRFMASAYLPIDAQYGCKTQIEPYMPPLTAKVFEQLGQTLGLPSSIFEKAEIEVCDLSAVTSGGNITKREFPIVVFSPGLSGTRLVYGALARSLASRGYMVFTIDHTYEALVVEFPDGVNAYAAPFDFDKNSTILQLLDVRTRDASFLVSQLLNATYTTPLFANFPGTLNASKVAVSGHSLGGATAATTAQRDSRVIGGLNFDGTIYGPVRDAAFKGKPFVLAASAAHAHSDPSILEWDTFYQKLDAAKMRLIVHDTQHYAFTDVPLLLDVFPVPSASQPKVDQVFGTANGTRVEENFDEITVGLLQLLFENKTGPFENLRGDPDLTVIASSVPRT